ncbi:NAC domain-containing protein 60-like [Syzygium oleosum]|uniref:NAC domain-containing protein 60-like n=1 Tax=Syzygium oleosum TaxID=219896 RepID=UPI0024BB4D5E|nr:NAC domain-containing protein 60-like [Syzygium oleosum]
MAGPSSREPQMTIAASSMFPGFRFSPTDEELISYYLKKKIDGCEESVEVISEVEICRHEPWDLPAKSIIRSENEWFFFNARGRKYPHGTQSRRATERGYWKATGKERNVKAGSRVIGTKRTLVFHLGRAPKGERTEWIMHEYCMDGKSQDSPVICRLRRNTEFRINDGSNQASSSQIELSSVDNRNHGMSEGGIDGTTLSEAAEGFARRCPSSYDSDSVEQMDSASESNQNLPNEVTMTESSVRQKDTGDEEDFFADILKDDIIKLDDSADSTVPPALPMESRQLEAERRTPGDEEDFFADILEDDIIKLDYSADSTVPPALPMESRQLEAERRSQEPIEASLSQVLNFPTEPSRRFNPRVPEQSIASALEGLELKGEHSAGKGQKPSDEQPPTCLLTTIVAGKTFGRRFSSAVLAIAIIAGLLVFLLGGYPRAKPIARDFAVLR